MGRLDELDLSLSLSKEEDAERLDGGPDAAAPRCGWRSAASCPATRAGSGRRSRSCFEGWDASGKGGALKRLVEPLDPRHVRVAQFAAPTPRREAPPLPVALLAGAARLGRDDRVRPLLVRARAGGAGRGLRDARAVGARLRRDRRTSSASLWRRGRRCWSSSGCTSPAEEQLQALQGARARIRSSSWKLTGRLAQPREAPAVLSEAVEDMLERTDHERRAVAARGGRRPSATRA